MPIIDSRSPSSSRRRTARVSDRLRPGWHSHHRGRLRRRGNTMADGTTRRPVRRSPREIRSERRVELLESTHLPSEATSSPPPPSLWPSLSSWNDDVIVAQDGWLLCRLAQALRRTPTPNAYHPFDRPLVVVVERRLHRRATCMVGCRVASHRHCAERQCLPPTSASDSCHRAPRHS